MGFTPTQAGEFFGAYHSGAPYVKPTMQMCADEVHGTGICRTILGRMTHFDLWQPIRKNWDEEQDAMPYDQAVRIYGSSIKRAYDYRAVNYKFQGSAADVFKASLDAADRSGVFDYIGVPRLLVHDETDFSVIDDTPQRNEAHKFFRHLCETTLPLRVPVRVDSKRGANWADAD
jgi:DNA polymerase-1